ncbi:MAG: mannose-1-phosphate guanylyltransferase [Candidatus Krumholzibacteriota bacterium]|nr:mannose-1-phosphate guanylyltransferase [Candidatus Krumholzibacteriota bacterium]
MYAVIIAGGRGTRFWPVSRSKKPKQYLDITGEGSMISVTRRRLASLASPGKTFVLTVADQVDLVQGECPDIPGENIFAEPAGRNTAPSLAVAAAMARRGGDEPMLCCPADHLIADTGAFHGIVAAAAAVAAEREALVTFGIAPTFPATGYGYIEAGPLAGEKAGRLFHEVTRFHEKPDADRARRYVERGGFYWNSGIFCWRPSIFLSAWERHLPDGVEPLDRIAAALGTDELAETAAAEYPRMPAVSVDYGILEKAENVLVFPADLGWSDVGSWDALADVLDRDGDGNAVAGGCAAIDSRRCLFFNPGGFTAAVGVDDLVVVVEGSTVLVCRKGDSQRVRELIDAVGKAGRDDLL